MNKKISQFEVASSIKNLDIIPIVQDGENKIITKYTLEEELAETFVVDSEFEEQIGDINSGLDALEKKHDVAISDVNDVVQDWTTELATRPTFSQMESLINRIIVCENNISKLANTIANAEVSGGGSSSGVVPAHSQSTATIFPLTGYVKDTNADPLTQYDTLNQALSKLENQIANAGTGGGIDMPLIKTNDTTNATNNDGALFTAGAVEKRYLNVSGDTATGLIKLLQGFQVGNEFVSGWTGKGASLRSIDNNKWKLEVDDLLVRGNMEVNELTINEIKAIGGDIIVTIADIECVEVQETTNGWKCYFDDPEGNKYSGFEPLDQAICQQFDGKNVRRYWRTVIEVNENENYIVLSKTQCEDGSGVPMAGDKIIQLGHRYDAGMSETAASNRRNAIFISSKGEDSPKIAFYKNIDDFTLVNKETTVIGTNSKFVGTFTQVSSGNNYTIPIYKGLWSLTATYNYYDQVTHNGSLWICMEDNVVASEPNINNNKWQLQVEKGESTFAEGAKFIEITGDRLFLYETADYSGTPTPNKIVLYATAHGLSDEATYTWTIQGEVVSKLGEGNVLEVYPSIVAGKSATIRCTATESDGSTYFDDYQIVKLANGESNYYLDLSNSTVAVPFNYEKTAPLLPLPTFYTEVRAYFGTKEIAITNLISITIEGSASTAINSNIVRLSEFTTGHAVIRIIATLEDGTAISKDWNICRIINGKDGKDGVGIDASYVIVGGEQVFKQIQNTTEFIPNSISLSALCYNILDPIYQWYWSIPGSGEWHSIAGASSEIYTVYANSNHFADKDEVAFKCEVVAKAGGNSYYDIITLNRLYNGKDGVDGIGSYRGVLTNETHTVASTYDGIVMADELNNAQTGIDLYYATDKLNPTEFTWEVRSLSSYTTKYWEEDYTNNILKLKEMPTDTIVLRVKFLVDGKEIDSCDFTVTKAKAGTPGDYEVSVYTTKDSDITSVSAPTFKEIPSSSGILDNGSTWFTDPKTENDKVVWRSVGLFDGVTNRLKDGQTWTTPVLFQGAIGKTGRGIVSITEYYKIHTSGSVAPTSGWSTTVQTPTATSRYLWNYENILYTNSTKPESTAPRVIGVYGDPGSPGRGVKSITEYYARGYEDKSKPSTSAFDTTVPELTAEYPYLWNYTKTTYTTGESVSTDPIIIGVRGNDGNKGNGIEYVKEFYALTNTSTTLPAESDWSEEVKIPDATYKYLWNYEEIKYTEDNEPTKGTPRVIGVYGNTGRGILTMFERYAKGAKDQSKPAESEFRGSIPTLTDDYPYLWNLTVIYYTDLTNNSATAYDNAIIIGYKGTDGKGIDHIVEKYGLSSNSSTEPTTWVETLLIPTSTQRYLWNYEIIYYNDGSEEQTNKRIISVYGESGKGIETIQEYYARGYKNKALPSSSEFKLNTVPDLTADYPYLWNYTYIKYTDGTDNGADYLDAVIISMRGNDGESITGPQGPQGPAGPTGPAMNFRGEYSPSATYYRSNYRVDVVKSGNYYYMVYPGRNGFSNKAPSSYYVTESTTSLSAYWIRISSFEMLATGLLLAEEATIAGWVFDPNYNVMRSSSGHVALKGTDTSGGALMMAIGSDSSTLGWKDNAMNNSASIRMYASGTIFLGNKYEAGISGRNDKTDNTDFRFWCNGARNDSNATFYVRHDGYLKASNAVITGDFQTISSGNRIKISNANNFQMFDSYSNNVLNLGFETNSTQGYTQPRLAMAAMTSSASVISSVVVNGVSLQCRAADGTTLFSVSHNGFWGKTSAFPTQQTVVNYSSGTLYVDTSDNNRIKLKF